MLTLNLSVNTPADYSQPLFIAISGLQFLAQNFADVFGDRALLQRLALVETRAARANRIALVVQIRA
jgi:hypothetical protein